MSRGCKYFFKADLTSLAELYQVDHFQALKSAIVICISPKMYRPDVTAPSLVDLPLVLEIALNLSASFRESRTW